MTWIPNKNPKNLFGDLRAVNRSNIVELKSIYGVSALRNLTSIAGSATVTNNNGEYILTTTTNGADSATLSSSERGRYVAGQEGECGIGFRTASSFSGSMSTRWGYYDNNNGYGFGIDATGVFVFDRTGGTETKVYQSSWNADVMDGTTNSGLTLDVSDGNIYEIGFAWYGYGTIEYRVITHDPTTKEQKVITVHRLRKTGSVSTQDPNLPIRAEVNNGGTATSAVVYVGGRQFSTWGDFNPNRRITSEYNLSVGSIGTTFVPLVSLRRKSAFESVSVKVEGFDLLVDANMLFELRVNATLTSPTWGALTDTTASETAVESDVSASALSNGELLYAGLISSATGRSTDSGTVDSLEFDLPSTQPVTLAVRTVSGTGATASGVLRIKEEW